MVVLPYVVDHWDSLPAAERKAQQEFLLPSLILDGYLFTGFAAAAPARERSMKLVGMQPQNHAQYLDFCEKVLDLFKVRGGRSVKLLVAYHRPLRFEDVPDAEAAELFSRGPARLPRELFLRLQDNLCRHLLAMANRRNLPLIVHTGYATPTAWGDPEPLSSMLRSPQLRGMAVDLCHSGWPHEGAAMIMARSHPRCYFNLCWTPLLSRSLGSRILAEAIDMVPIDRILLGTDCGSIESFVGTVSLVRQVLIEVLTRKVREGQFTAAVAAQAATRLLHDNAKEFYGGLL
jgi:hypothetical protein